MEAEGARWRIAATGWYHKLELGNGIVTPGWFDMRPYVGHYGIPERLDGLRVLEVGTWDGFWAFELERRGAAEVVALDLDDERELDWPRRRRPAELPAEPRGRGFAIAHEILGSKVQRVVRSIYHATREELGTFDLVFCGSVLVHLRDQLLALERMAGLCTGQLILAEEHDRTADLVPWPVSRYHADRDKAVVFWLPSIRTWKRMAWTAGFDRVDKHATFKMQGGEGEKAFTVPHVVLHAHKT
jgi:tRNA (mo5U34)-methyltransferase